MRSYPKSAIILIACFSSLCATQVNALCARCEQIEEDRAREQALHPHKVGYYEDEISLADKKSVPLQKNTQTMSSNENSAFMLNQGNVSPSSYGTATVNGDPSFSPSFSTVAAILKTKDLLPALKGPFTIFIPSNEAFRKMQPGALHNLLSQENSENLAFFVSNHIVPVKLDKAALKNSNLKNLNGTNLNIAVNGENVFVNGAKVLHAEKLGDNGMLFIIDKAILPELSNRAK
ncbi:MAG: fasciclin domain-containing protein [Candidatus Protochlamydia sp.]|nr:fasciclin domain-containing protein [Candidatus Protochlamydia sp.]